MIARTLAAALALGLATVAFAQTPNIEPGLWEYTNKFTFSGDVPLPDQNHTEEKCVTQDEIVDGLSFFQGMEGCEFSQRDITESNMDFKMTCEQPDGTRMDASGSMQFNGDHTSATMRATIESQMGPMDIAIEMNSKRLGDC